MAARHGFECECFFFCECCRPPHSLLSEEVYPVTIINTGYQKLPFGSGDYPGKLLYHQALNYQFLTHQTGNYPVTCFVSKPSRITFKLVELFITNNTSYQKSPFGSGDYPDRLSTVTRTVQQARTPEHLMTSKNGSKRMILGIYVCMGTVTV